MTKTAEELLRELYTAQSKYDAVHNLYKMKLLENPGTTSEDYPDEINDLKIYFKQLQEIRYSVEIFLGIA